MYITITQSSKMSLKPYRSIRNYEPSDKKYTDDLKKTFNELPPHLKSQFQLFTENLMDDEYISNFKLLDAIRDFKIKNNKICSDSPDWKSFDDKAFNYRPWQCW